MAKIFAVVRDNESLKLMEWSSRAAFSKTESFIDPKWIYIASTTDYKELGIFNEPMESVESNPSGSTGPSQSHLKSWSIFHTEDEINAHNMLHRALKNQVAKTTA